MEVSGLQRSQVDAFTRVKLALFLNGSDSPFSSKVGLNTEAAWVKLKG